MANFTPMTGDELQEARRKAAARFEAIGFSHVPEGWSVEYRKSLSGCCWTKRNLIEAPRPVTRRALYIFLHECAHAHLHVGSRKASHVKELEAEQWAHERMRAANVPVPRKSTKQAKAYVGHKIQRARKAGAKSIDAKARAFAKSVFTKRGNLS